MIDLDKREKVIKGLECCFDVQSEWKDKIWACQTCPYAKDDGEPCETLAPLLDEALALLKAQEQVKPILDSRAIEFYRCGQCNEPIDACKNCNRYTGNREGWGNLMANQYDAYKPVKIDRYTYDCGNCGARVMYAYGLGTYSHGASESYEDWAVKQCNFCPKCGKRVKWDG